MSGKKGLQPGRAGAKKKNLPRRREDAKGFFHGERCYSLPCLHETTWQVEPICCANRLCWFSLVPGEGAAVMTSYYKNKPRRHAKGREDEVFIIKSFCGGSKRLKIRRWEGRKKWILKQFIFARRASLFYPSTLLHFTPSFFTPWPPEAKK
jgi:hypothetical protein